MIAIKFSGIISAPSPPSRLDVIQNQRGSNRAPACHESNLWTTPSFQRCNVLRPGPYLPTNFARRIPISNSRQRRGCRYRSYQVSFIIIQITTRFFEVGLERIVRLEVGDLVATLSVVKRVVIHLGRKGSSRSKVRCRIEEVVEGSQKRRRLGLWLNKSSALCFFERDRTGIALPKNLH
jgi:hypothetical protein